MNEFLENPFKDEFSEDPTEIQDEWDEFRGELLLKEQKLAFDAYCEKSKNVYRAMKKTGIWPKNRKEAAQNQSDFHIVMYQLAVMHLKKLYDLADFMDWLKESINAAFQGKEIGESPYKEILTVNDYDQMIRMILAMRKLIDEGVTEFTPDTHRFLSEKFHMKFHDPYDEDEDSGSFLDIPDAIDEDLPWS